MTTLRRVVQIPIYWLFVGIAVMVVSPMVSTGVSVWVNKRTMAQAEAARRATQVESLQRACRLIGAQIDVFGEAESPVGQRAREAWLLEYRLSRCQPSR